MSWYDERFLLYLATILGSFAIFQWIYTIGADAVFRKYIPKEYESMSERKRSLSCSGATSSVHGSFMFLNCAYLLLFSDLHLDKCWKDSLHTQLLTCMEVGFYFSDTFVMLRGKSELEGVFAYALHHLCVITGSLMTVVCKVFAFFICLRGLSDLSVPFQHMRVLLVDVNRKDDRVYLINGILFMLSFFFARVCIIPITFSSIWQMLPTAGWARVHPISKVIFLVFPVIVDSLNLYWFNLILKGVYKVLAKKKEV